MTEIINYINWKQICKDFNLKYGDISPHQTNEIIKILNEFIKQNK
tara:strand:- start:421 stop:555 length:135 start_codon:yes stop_codon:yes gene_type:complete